MPGALRTFAAAPGSAIAYTETIRHPALTAPLFAKGTLELSEDNTLIRRQGFPEAETIEIRDNTVRITRVADGYDDTLPITDQGLPLIGLLRDLVRGTLTDPGKMYRTVFLSDSDGWSLTLTPKDPAGALEQVTLSGCAQMAHSIQIQTPSGEMRRIEFAQP